ncbi:tetratricopeptide repeat protein [Echinicola marina]|uniref:tetratricopeptide repeat protein n=1 Tax=Echinicola marina TaxID=2859768 RepID=UPI001CF67120|nr:tetratricopeptide repeat protein [Echinicola marina]UCS92987.1 tetratricopeptide repeat protein [Echinicola marina]
MSKSSRIEQLLQFIKDEPDNPFNIYALALEHQNSAPSKAAEYFDQLITHHPKYLPTYFHAAAFFAEMDQIDKAQQIYKTGIDLAQSQNNLHALRELKNAYQNFIFENDLD